MDILQEFFRYLQNEKRFSKNTLNAYQTDLAQFCLYCQNSQVVFPEKVDSLFIRSWVVTLIEDSLSTRSVNRKLSALKVFFRFMEKQNLLTRNPMLSIVPPRTKKRLPEFVSESQMESLFSSSYFSEDFSGLRDRIVLLFFYLTGVRVSELVEILDSDIDFSRAQVKVTGKRNKQRLLPLSENFIAEINTYIKARQIEFPNLLTHHLFVDDKGKKLYVKWVYRLVNGYLSNVTTLEKKSPHVLRHTFATHLLNNGADLMAIKELLGHTSLAATQVYTHNSFEKLKRVYKQAHPRA
jgi:integrase/recombinase XerC